MFNYHYSRDICACFTQDKFVVLSFGGWHNVTLCTKFQKLSLPLLSHCHGVVVTIMLLWYHLHCVATVLLLLSHRYCCHCCCQCCHCHHHCHHIVTVIVVALSQLLSSSLPSHRRYCCCCHCVIAVVAINAYSFCQYMNNIVRAYQNQGVDLIGICQLFSWVV